MHARHSLVQACDTGCCSESNFSQTSWMASTLQRWVCWASNIQVECASNTHHTSHGSQQERPTSHAPEIAGILKCAVEQPAQCMHLYHVRAASSKGIRPIWHTPYGGPWRHRNKYAAANGPLNVCLAQQNRLRLGGSHDVPVARGPALPASREKLQPLKGWQAKMLIVLFTGGTGAPELASLCACHSVGCAQTPGPPLGSLAHSKLPLG